MPDPIAELSRGTQVGIYRKGKLIHTGHVIHKSDANSEMTWGHKMGPEWIVTVFVSGLGPRRWQRGRFRAKDLRRFGNVDIRAINNE
jgi:hypothetical protein